MPPLADISSNLILLIGSCPDKNTIFDTEETTGFLLGGDGLSFVVFGIMEAQRGDMEYFTDFRYLG